MFNNIIVDIFIYYTFHHFPNTAKKWDGPTGDLLHWLDDYVSDRKQKVHVVDNNECSNTNTVKAGIPQGSVPGPLLFLLYINDITDNSGNLARLFAQVEINRALDLLGLKSTKGQARVFICGQKEN
jgi:hypothetical protein